MKQMNRSNFLKLASLSAVALVAMWLFVAPTLVLAQHAEEHAKPAISQKETAAANDHAATASKAVEQAADEHGAGDHKEHADAGASPFAGTIYQSIAAVIVFVLLYIVLNKLAFGPILKGLKDREDKIKADLHRAEDAALSAEKTLKEYQAQLAAARVEGQKIVETARLNAEKLAHEIQSQAQKDIDAAKSRATAEITFAKETALREIFTQTASLATDVAGKILRREINAQDQQNLVAESLASLRRENLQ